MYHPGMTRSPWQRNAASPSIETDLVIVGAGIVGLSALLHASVAGLNAVLIEKQHIAFGASGRNAGYLMTGADDNYAAAVKAWGRDTAKFMWEVSRRTLSGLRQLGIESLPSYKLCPSCLVPMSQEELNDLQASIELMQTDGFDAEIMQRPIDDALTRSLQPEAVLVQHSDAICNPAEVCYFLAGLAPKQAILERTELQAVTHSQHSVFVQTSGPTISTKNVLLATNAYTPLILPQTDKALVPNRAQMLSLEAFRSGELLRSYYLDRGSEYIRQHGTRILVGGWRKYDQEAERTLVDQPSETIQSGLESFASRALNRQITVTDRWSGPMAFTPDHRPLVGRTSDLPEARGPSAANEHSMHHPNIWICSGFTGHGMSLGYETASIAIQCIINDDPTIAAALNCARLRDTAIR